MTHHYWYAWKGVQLYIVFATVNPFHLIYWKIQVILYDAYECG